MKRIVCFFVLAFAYSTGMACDICGCYMGLTPYNNFSSVGVYYRYRAFNGYPIANQSHQLFPSSVFRQNKTAKLMHGGIDHDLPAPDDQEALDSLFPAKDYELYRVYELRAKFFIHKRLEINALIPFYSNSSREHGTLKTLSGIGDINAFMGYHIISRPDDPLWKRRLVVGTGIKMRTGKYLLADENNFRFDPLLQPGTGSNDWLLYTNFMLGYKSIGLNSTVMYKVNGSNVYDERIGNSITSYANFFYIAKLGDVQIIPSAQFYHEYTKGLFRKDELIPNTAMTEIMLGPGLDIMYKGFLINTGVQFTVYSGSEATNPGSAGRMILGLSYNFLQKKHLIN
jgi:hypothetical protein